MQDGSILRLQATRVPGAWRVSEEQALAFLNAVQADRNPELMSQAAAAQAAEAAQAKAAAATQAAIDDAELISAGWARPRQADAAAVAEHAPAASPRKRGRPRKTPAAETA